eukprot:GDKJ01017106.1.p1 GENE.GDKJ01017106.1~~GDKJ01017106.1.p1  ORF type:complete len:265 (-),score=58.90 GDKJ01017106.1:37-831(-)
MVAVQKFRKSNFKRKNFAFKQRKRKELKTVRNGAKVSTNSDHSKKRVIDSHAPTNHKVYADWDAFLVLTDLSDNNNKFLVLQLLYCAFDHSYIVFTRWGRIGEEGAQLVHKGDLKTCEKLFLKKYFEKTKNRWLNTPEDSFINFTAYKNKYHLTLSHVNNQKKKFLHPLVYEKAFALLQELNELLSAKRPISEDEIDEIKMLVSEKTSLFYCLIPTIFEEKTRIFNQSMLIDSKEQIDQKFAELEAASPNKKHEIETKIVRFPK